MSDPETVKRPSNSESTLANERTYLCPTISFSFRRGELYQFILTRRGGHFPCRLRHSSRALACANHLALPKRPSQVVFAVNPKRAPAAHSMTAAIRQWRAAPHVLRTKECQRHIHTKLASFVNLASLIRQMPAMRSFGYSFLLVHLGCLRGVITRLWSPSSLHANSAQGGRRWKRVGWSLYETWHECHA